MNKILGYILAIAGLIGLGTMAFPQIKDYLKIPATIPSLYIIVGSVALILIGAVLIIKSGGSKPKEVPIYHGNSVVGYRRH